MNTTNNNLSFYGIVRLIRNNVNDVVFLLDEEATVNETMTQIADHMSALKAATPDTTEGKLIADIVRNAVGTVARTVKAYMDREISRVCAVELINRQEHIIWSAWALIKKGE